MSVDIKTVKRVARLSRIVVKGDEAERMDRVLFRALLSNLMEMSDLLCHKVFCQCLY